MHRLKCRKNHLDVHTQWSQMGMHLIPPATMSAMCPVRPTGEAQPGLGSSVCTGSQSYMRLTLSTQSPTHVHPPTWLPPHPHHGQKEPLGIHHIARINLTG